MFISFFKYCYYVSFISDELCDDIEHQLNSNDGVAKGFSDSWIHFTENYQGQRSYNFPIVQHISNLYSQIFIWS